MGIFGWGRKKAAPPRLTSRQLVTVNIGGITTPYTIDPSLYIDKAYKQNPVIYSIVTTIAARASEAPIEQFKVKSTEKLSKAARFANTPGIQYQAVAKSMMAQALDQVGESDLLNLLARPNTYQSFYDFFNAACITRLLSGDLYILKVRGASGTKVYELHVMPSYDIEPICKGIMREIDYYRLRSNPQRRFNPSDIIHIHSFSPLTNDRYLPPVGLSPIEAAKDVLQKANTIEGSSVQQYGNMGAVGAAYIDDPSETDIQPGDMEQLETRWYQKLRNSLGSILWSNSKIGFTKFTSTVKEMDVIPMAKYATEQLCMIYRFPSLIFSNEAKTLDNLKGAREQIITDCVLPLQAEFCRGLMRGLLPDFKGSENDILKFDSMYYPEMQADLATVGPVLEQLTFISENEKRDWMSYDRYDDPKADIPKSLWVQAQVDPQGDNQTVANNDKSRS